MYTCGTCNEVHVPPIIKLAICRWNHLMPPGSKQGNARRSTSARSRTARPAAKEPPAIGVGMCAASGRATGSVHTGHGVDASTKGNATCGADSRARTRPTADVLHAEIARRAPAADAADCQTQGATGNAVATDTDAADWNGTRVAASHAPLKVATATTSGAIAKAATTDEQDDGRQCSEATGASTSRADAKEATADDEESRWCSS